VDPRVKPEDDEGNGFEPTQVKNTEGPLIFRPAGLFIQGILYVALDAREVGGVDAERLQVAFLRAAVPFDSRGGCIGSAQYGEGPAEEALGEGVAEGGHWIARFLF
jgi:hypothetical protein